MQTPTVKKKPCGCATPNATPVTPKFRREESKRKAKFYADNPAYRRRVKRKVKARRAV
jgi:hypothetical protein